MMRDWSMKVLLAEVVDVARTSDEIRLMEFAFIFDMLLIKLYYLI